MECRIVDTEACPIAVLRDTTTHGELADTIYRLVDQVWAFVRSDQVSPPLVTNHNVVVYRWDDAAKRLDVEVGVQVDRAFTEVGPTGVFASSLPGGRTATATHTGSYDAIGQSFTALHEWAREQGLRETGVTWEVYGDWNDDETKLETELFVQVAD